MSFSETIFLFFLALIVFGPKKLPEIARQAGKLLAELRRASNEFRSQIESEIAHLEVEKRVEVEKKADAEKKLDVERKLDAERKKDLALPTEPPPGAVASMSLNSAPPENHTSSENATLAAPVTGALPDPAASMPTSAEAIIDNASVPATQDSHV